MNWLHDWATRWHDAWDIIGAIATTAAVIVALVGISHERRRAKAAEDQRDLERAQVEAERTANREAEHRRQAQRVVAYPSWFVQARGIGGHEIGYWKVRLSNHSDAPVFDIYVETYVESQRINATGAPVFVPGSDQWMDHKDLDEYARPPAALLYFRDLAGTRWRREQDGRLSEVDEDRNLI